MASKTGQSTTTAPRTNRRRPSRRGAEQTGEQNAERGFLSKLFSSDPKVKPEQYRVQVRQTEEASQVTVLNKDGTAENSRTTQRILSLLHTQLK